MLDVQKLWGAGLEEEKRYSGRIAWGTGRIAFNAHWPFIQQQIDAGCPMTAVYKQIHDSLAGMSYNVFTYHARKRFTPTAKNWRMRYRRSSSAQTSINADNNQSQTTGAISTSVFRGFVPGPKVPNLDELF